MFVSFNHLLVQFVGGWGIASSVWWSGVGPVGVLRVVMLQLLEGCVDSIQGLVEQVICRVIPWVREVVGLYLGLSEDSTDLR
jgi:hypothetical protein